MGKVQVTRATANQRRGRRRHHRCRALKGENSKLREELSAGLDFFEEIEDLKFKYAEAMQRLQQYA